MASIVVTPEDLQALGSKCTQESSSIEAVRTGITSAIANTNWESPAATRFKDDWNTKYVKALSDLEQALQQLGQAANTMAQNYTTADDDYTG